MGSWNQPLTSSEGQASSSACYHFLITCSIVFLEVSSGTSGGEGTLQEGCTPGQVGLMQMLIFQAVTSLIRPLVLWMKWRGRDPTMDYPPSFAMPSCCLSLYSPSVFFLPHPQALEVLSHFKSKTDLLWPLQPASISLLHSHWQVCLGGLLPTLSLRCPKCC